MEERGVDEVYSVVEADVEEVKRLRVTAEEDEDG